MKPKTLARILCVILCIVLVGSVLLVAIPMMNADAAEHTPVLGGGGIVTEDYVNLRSDASTDASAESASADGASASAASSDGNGA